MRQLFVSIMLFAALLCAAVAQQSDSFMVYGQMRSFVMHVPSGLTTPPLVISMHGHGGTGSQQRSMTGFDKIADREHFIVVYPNGLNNSWIISGDTDVVFLTALIDTMSSRYGIDRNRVYATGFSMGGFMSYKLACSAADKFAAVGPVSGMTLTYGCAPSRPMPIIHIHGTADTLVKYSGVAATISFWVGKDSCPSTPQTTKPYPDTNPNSKVTKDYYGPCKRSSEIILLSVDSMGQRLSGRLRRQLRHQRQRGNLGVFQNPFAQFCGNLARAVRADCVARSFSALLQGNNNDSRRSGNPRSKMLRR